MLDKMKTGEADYPQQGDVEALHFSSPCNGFSRANRERLDTQAEASRLRKNKKNNDLSLVGIDVVKLLKPKLVSFENVLGMIKVEKNKKYAQIMIARLLASGYDVRLFILDASDFGVPQKRQRVFMVATAPGIPLPGSPKRTTPEKVTLQNVLGEIEGILPVSGSGRVRLGDGTVICGHKIPSVELRTEMEHLSQTRDGIVPTVRCTKLLKHYVHQRPVTIYEMGQIQGFPKWYKFYGSDTDARKQIGNAVPPPMAYAVGVALMKVYFETYFPGEDPYDSQS